LFTSGVGRFVKTASLACCFVDGFGFACLGCTYVDCRYDMSMIRYPFFSLSSNIICFMTVDGRTFDSLLCVVRDRCPALPCLILVVGWASTNERGELGWLR